MEGNLETFGCSLLVPCVQEVAKESLTTVPARYIRHDQDPPITSYATSIPDVPTIDMEKLLSGDHTELKKLDSASKEWGFFQLINHGVSAALLEKVKLEINGFFNLPMEAKKKFWQDSEDFEGFGQANVLSEEQKLDWGDMFFLTTLPTHSRKPHLFPKLPLPFRDTLDNYAYELKQLAMKILDFMSKALKMKAEEMRDFFEEGRQSMRMNYYPPCPQPEKVNGLTPHSDGAGLTILLQINEMEGLQIKKDGMWVPVKPLPQTFVINIGDSLESIDPSLIVYRRRREGARSGSVRDWVLFTHCASLFVTVHDCSALFTTARRCSRLLGAVHDCSALFTIVRHCSCTVHSCLALFMHVPSRFGLISHIWFSKQWNWIRGR